MQINNASKKELRQWALSARRNISEKTRVELSDRIDRNLFSLKEFCEASSVLCYVSKEFEIPTEKIISRCLEEGKRIAVPVCIGENMLFKYITGFRDLESGSFGVREPKQYCEAAKITEKTVCITPALCCSPDGYRIGYGKGFYDRFFEKNECVKVGLCCCGFIKEFIPDCNDIALDIIVTEQGFLSLS